MTRRLLFVAIDLKPSGGAAAVAAWAVQALREDWRVTVLTFAPPDWQAINTHFGTALQARDFELITAPAAIRRLVRLDPDPASFQRAAWLMRRCKTIGSGYDVILGVDSELDFGRPGIQYMHYTYRAHLMPIIDAIHSMPRWRRFVAFLRGRYRLWMLISGFDFDHVRANYTLTNSDWTGRAVRDHYGIDSVTVHPPVTFSTQPRDWSKRADRFVTLGRFSPKKRVLEMIDVIERVRRRGHELELCIIGDLYDRSYFDKVRARAVEAGPWVTVEHTLTRRELEEKLVQSRYGLHGRSKEHFGIAVAEMVRAGCIVFVPDGGGQVEIVGRDPDLTYATDDQAVENICRVLNEEAIRNRLRATLAERARDFTEDRFMSRLREAVAAFQPGE